MVIIDWYIGLNKRIYSGVGNQAKHHASFQLNTPVRLSLAQQSTGFSIVSSSQFFGTKNWPKLGAL